MQRCLVQVSWAARRPSSLGRWSPVQVEDRGQRPWVGGCVEMAREVQVDTNETGVTVMELVLATGRPALPPAVAPGGVSSKGHKLGAGSLA